MLYGCCTPGCLRREANGDLLLQTSSNPGQRCMGVEPTLDRAGGRATVLKLVLACTSLFVSTCYCWKTPEILPCAVRRCVCLAVDVGVRVGVKRLHKNPLIERQPLRDCCLPTTAPGSKPLCSRLVPGSVLWLSASPLEARPSKSEPLTS